MVFTHFMLVEVVFFKLSFKTFRLTFSWTITAVSKWSSVCNFWCRMQSKRWLLQTMLIKK